MADVTIGRVSVKVYPDTKGFRGDLKRQLAGIEDDLKIEIDAVLNTKMLQRHADAVAKRMNSKAEKRKRQIEFDVELDDSGIVAKARATSRRVDAAMEDHKIKLSVDPESYDSVRQALAQIDREIERLREVSLEVETDEDSLNAARDLIAEQLEKSSFKLKVSEDSSGWASAIKKLDDMIRDRVGEVELEVGADLDSLTATRNMLQDKIDKEPIRVKYADDPQGWGDIRSKIAARLRELQTSSEFDLNVSEESLREAYNKFDKLINDYDQTEIDFQAHVEALAARAELARVARDRIVTMHVNVSKSSLAKAEATLAALSGLRLLHSTLDNLWDSFKNLDKNIPIIGGIAEAVMGLSAWLLAAASNTFALAKSLAEIGPLALLLPGMAGGFAIGLGSAIAVLKDFKKVLPEVGQELGHIQDLMSTAFYASAAEPIRDLVDHLFPQLQRGLVTTSALLGTWFGGLADSLTTSLDGSLDQMFGDLAVSIGIASTANDDLSTSIRVLGKYGSQYLPRLAGWYKDVAESFADWLTKNDENGKLTDWIELGIDNLQDLGRVAKESGGIVAGIFRAADAAGGSNLSMLADTLERVHKTVDGANFQRNLIQVLEAAHNAMSLIAEKSGPAVKAFFSDFSSILATGFRTAGSAIGDLLDGIFRGLNTDGFKTGFLDFLSGLSDGIASLNGVWEPLGNAIGAIGSLAGEMARNFGPLLAQVLTSIADMVTQLGPKIIPVIENLTSMVGSALDGLIPIIEGVVSVLGTIASGVGSSPAAVLALATAFVAFRAALAGKAIADGLVGLMSFVGRSGDVSKMAGSISRLGIAVGGIAVAAVGIDAIGNWFSNAGKQAVDVNKLSTAIADLGLGDFAAKSQALNSLVGGNESWLNKLTDFTDIAGAGIDGSFASDIQGIGDAMQIVDQYANSSGWDKVFGNNEATHGWMGKSGAFRQGKETLEAFDQSMANLVNSGNMDAIALGERFMADEAAKAGVSLSDATAQMPQYAAAKENLAVVDKLAAEQQAAAVAQTKAAMDQYVATMSQTKGLTPALSGEINDLSKDFIDLSGALGDSLPSVDSWLTSLEKQSTALTEWADNLATLKERGVSDAVIGELARMEAEGAPMVAQLVDATDADLARLEPIIAARLGGAATTSTGMFQKLSEQGAAAVATLPLAVQEQLADAGVLIQDETGQWGTYVTDGLASAQTGAAAAGQGVANAANEGLALMPGYFSTAGTNAGSAFATGVGTTDITTAISGITSTVNAVMGIGLAIQMQAAGQQAGGGLVTGIGSQAGAVSSASQQLGTNAASGVKSAVPQMQSSGVQAGNGLASGIRSAAGSVTAAARGLVTGATVVVGLLGVQLRVRGTQGSQGLASGLRSGAGSVTAAGAALAVSASAGTIVLPILMLARGIASGASFANGIRASVGAAGAAGGALASAAQANAHADLYGAGVNAGAGFAAGIRSQVGAAAAAAASIAAAASAAARKKLDIHSPSRVFAKIGDYTVKGFTKSVKKGKKSVQKTTAKVFGPGMYTKVTKKNKKVVRRNGIIIANASIKPLKKVASEVRNALDFNHKDRLAKTMKKTTAKVVKRTAKMVTQINKAIDKTNDPLGRVKPNRADLKKDAKRAMGMRAESFAHSKSGAGLTVEFNGPVGTDPTQIARKIEQRQMDALAMEGLVS